MKWIEAQKWEQTWWGDCVNTFSEEQKQYIYAKHMGLNTYATNYFGQRGWNFGDRSVLDVGCGPVSMLLKSKATFKVGIDPCDYPGWVEQRYKAAGVDYRKVSGEEMDFGAAVFDISLLYNCLQHTDDPELIVKNIKKCSREIHVFEWINCGISDGHIHNLTEENLNEWFGGEGKVIELNEYPCVGTVYCGIFKGDMYEV